MAKPDAKYGRSIGGLGSDVAPAEENDKSTVFSGPMPRRKNEITWCTVVLCLLVIFIHVSSDPIVRLDRASGAFFAVFAPWRLAAFVVPGFLFLSGCKLFLRPPEGLGRFYIGRLRHIVLPYLAWVTIYYLYFVYHRQYFPFSWRDLGGYFLIGNLSSQFYFVVIVVQFYLLWPLWRWLTSRVPAKILLPLAFVGMLVLPQFLYRDRVFPTYLGYWLLGCYFGRHYHAWAERVERALPLLGVFWAGLAALDLFFTYRSFFRLVPMELLEALHLLYCIAAILFLFSLARRLARRPLPQWAGRLAAVSFSIYLCHCLVIQVVNEWLVQWNIWRVSTSYILRILLVYGISLGLCLAYGRIRERKP